MSNIGNEAKEKSKLRLWVENYWYHYKWQTVFVVFFLIVGIICTVQAVENQKYDSFIMYAGDYQMSRVQVVDMENSFSRVVQDNDGDGKVNVAVRDLFLLSQEQIEEINDNDEGYKVNATLITSNWEIFDQEIMAGEATICLLSPMLFERVRDAGGFLLVEEFVGEADVEYYDKYGVYLKSLPFSSLNGLSFLPDDTILCVRRASTMASIFGREKEKKRHAINLESFKNIFEYGLNSSEN